MRPFPILALTTILWAAGCHARPLAATVDPETGGRVITEADIERSGAATAWDVVMRSGKYLSVHETPRGEPGRIRQRGNSSMLLSNSPVLIIDGVEMVDFSLLRDMRASTISRMVILSGTQATLRHGTSAGNGAIVIHTKVVAR